MSVNCNNLLKKVEGFLIFFMILNSELSFSTGYYTLSTRKRWIHTFHWDNNIKWTYYPQLQFEFCLQISFSALSVTPPIYLYTSFKLQYWLYTHSQGNFFVCVFLGGGGFSIFFFFPCFLFAFITQTFYCLYLQPGNNHSYFIWDFLFPASNGQAKRIYFSFSSHV